MTEHTETPRPFQLRKLGHVVLNVTDLEASVCFYTDVLGLEVSDRYPDSMVPGGMVFLRYNTDHHGVALVGGARKTDGSSLNHFAFEVGALDEVFRARAWLRAHGVPIVFEGRRRAGCQIAVEFRDPDGNNLEIYWNIDQVGTNGSVRPPSEWRQARTLEDAVANPVAGQRVLPVPDVTPAARTMSAIAAPGQPACERASRARSTSRPIACR
jgi:catechol 2,3-dioxygenase